MYDISCYKNSSFHRVIPKSNSCNHSVHCSIRRVPYCLLFYGAMREKTQMPGTCAYLWSPDFDINRDACRAAAVLSWVWASTPSTSKSNLPRRWQRCSWSCVIHPANYSTGMIRSLRSFLADEVFILLACLLGFFFTENQLLWRRQAALYLVTSLVVAYLPACHINGVRCIFCWRQWG